MKLLDFGIAKLNHDHAPSRLTQIGDVMGSPYYLSPEQAEGLDDIDFRSDIWAIGVVGWFVIRYPHQRRSRRTPKRVRGDRVRELILERLT